ncbi:hypothetical protein [Desulfoluna spongiiphila]|uniref:hypothetical protein n=1 Tax=Desulfoluna spongiiphila TaxID=419481 RepID=UPI00125BB31D|nr:hypothetical protein [Desulfoluna spongiiphila]VVS94113.1 hypothetical protein DBB_36850 [Desulfoluna spongiiphila]
MKACRRIPYRLFCASRNTLLCEVAFSFSEPSAHHGRVTITLTYPEPSAGGAVRRHAQSQSWFTNSRQELLMCVGRFSLPDSLKRRGIGSWIWSRLHGHLPAEVQDRLILTGSLSSTDAVVPRTDTEGRPMMGSQGPLMMNQVALRNRFWSRMLRPVEDNRPVLWCDAEGNGAFRGQFRDPHHKRACRRILAETLPSDQRCRQSA